MSLQEVLVPDIGNFDSVDVIEVLVKAGDVIAKDDSLLTVESDKASMDIPAPFGGTIKEVKTKVGDKIAQGHLILMLEVQALEAAEAKAASPAGNTQAASSPAVTKTAAETPKVEPTIPTPSRPAPEPAKKIQPVHQPLPVGESVVVNGGKTSHASPSVRNLRAS